MEARVIEPVRRLRRGRKIDAVILERRLFREIAEIRDVRMRLRIPQLRDAAVGRDHALVVARKPTPAGRCRSRNPARLATRRQRREVVEQLLRIVRAVARIRARVPRNDP